VRVDADAEVARLQTVLRDLVALSAIPALWIGSEPPVVAGGLADALVSLLQLDVVFVRLSDPGGGGAVEFTRGSAWTSLPEWLEGRLAPGAPFPRKEVVPDVGDDSVRRRGFAVPVGVNGEGGVVAAASERSDFPTPRDQLLLSVAANHAAAAFQTSRLMHERKQAEEELRTARNELEVKVAERTAELHEANEELNALRHVATLVAEGVQPQVLFAVVAEEVARVVNVPLVSVVRYEPDGAATECASYSATGPLFPVGTRWSLEGTNVLQLVRASCEPARIDDYSQSEGEIADTLRRSGIRSTVGIPIVVAGRVWGAMVVSTTEQDPLPEGTEARLADFTELLATAIANAEGKSELTASRRRIVAASDEARRRIERDLHDGTQQRLIALALALRAAEANVAPDNGDLRPELSRIATGLADAVADLQEISRGIHPAILSQGGLGPALRTLARRSTIPVQLDITTNARLPEPIEVAAYYVASEALANATKHAQASCIDISLTTRNGSLLLSIRDDGVGGADPARGSGLAGLTDRVQALGGSIRVSSRPGDGTHITAELPVEQS
jgi:signal transduction histidine kinase